MSHQLTKQETQELFEVCERHGVTQYDVQIELVDHLASLIEQHWEENPEDPFKYALYKAFQKFGPVGFQQVKEQKQRALARKYNRFLWKYLLEFYRCPKMLFTLALSLPLTFLLQTINNTYYILCAYILLFLLVLSIYDSRYALNGKIKTIPGKSFLLLERLKQTKVVSVIVGNLPIALYMISNSVDINLSDYIVLLFILAFSTVSLSIVVWGYFIYIPKKIKEHFMEQFEEFAV